MQPKYPHVSVRLSGEDGNIFSILGRTIRAMKNAGLDQAEIDRFAKEATSSRSYDTALQCILRWVDAR